MVTIQSGRAFQKGGNKPEPASGGESDLTSRDYKCPFDLCNALRDWENRVFAGRII
jgi:hypothetical protein